METVASVVEGSLADLHMSYGETVLHEFNIIRGHGAVLPLLLVIL
jgi:hypothetical protein